MKIRNDAPSRKALTEEMSLRVCRLRAYSKTRLRLAEQPDEEQREERAVEKDEHGLEVDLGRGVWFSVLPVIFGSQ